MKHIVIIKNSSTKVDVCSDYLHISQNNNENIIAFRHIKELYINKNIELYIKDSVKLSKFFRLFLTDQYGNILAEVQNYEKI